MQQRAILSVPPRRANPIDRAFHALTRSALHPFASERDDIRDAIVGDDELVRAVLQRSAAPLATTTDAGFAAELGQNIVAQYVATLAPLSAAAAIVVQGLQVTMGRASSQKYPAREGAPSTTVAWVEQGDGIPVRSYALNDNCVLSPRKFGFIVAATREAAKRSGGDAAIRQLIREDAAASWDGAHFSDDAGDASTHAGMLAGVAALTGFPGGDREALESDLLALSDAVSAGGSGQLVFVTSPRRANRIWIKYPELASTMTFLPSLAVADANIIAVDPASWVHGFGETIDIDVSNEVILHMEDEAPASDIGDATGDVRSLWQTDALAYRFIADISFAARRPNAAAWLTGATW